MTILKPLLWMLVVAVSGIPPAAATSEINLSDYRWKHRLLCIFTPSTTDATFLALDKRLAQSALEIEDRELTACPCASRRCAICAPRTEPVVQFP
jgi:hypothetical protein